MTLNIWKSQGFSHCYLRENCYWRAKKNLKQEEADVNNREVKCLVICLACCMLEILTTNCVAKPRITPLLLLPLKEIVVWESHCCSWQTVAAQLSSELQEMEIQGYGAPNRKPTFPSFHCLTDTQIHMNYVLVFILLSNLQTQHCYMTF